MKENNSDINGLIARYLNGEASPEEVTSLSQWLDASQENRKLFEEYHQVWLLLAKDKVDKDIDISRDWKTFVSNTQEQPVLPSLARFNPESQPQNASYSLGQSKRIQRLSSFYTKVAAAVVVLIAASAVLFYLFLPSQNIIVTAASENTIELLPDGSTVSLMKGSSVEYRKDFQKSRELTLKGVAYFNVKHDAGHPFTVAAGSVRIKVLGTSFNVKSDEQHKNVSVVLSTGKIALYFKGKESSAVTVLPGERADINIQQKVIEKSVNTDPNYNAWLTRKIVFADTKLSEVALTLQDLYHTNIKLANTGLKECTLTATFDKQPLEEIMQVIGQTLGCDITQEEETYIIDGICD